jgi:hypothetical protein
MPKQADEVVNDVALDRERREPQKAEQGHFEELQLIEKGNRVNPFGPRPKIPKLPQKSAYQTRHKEKVELPQAPALPVRKKGFSTEPVVERLQEKDQAPPDERERVPRKKKGEK